MPDADDFQGNEKGKYLSYLAVAISRESSQGFLVPLTSPLHLGLERFEGNPERRILGPLLRQLVCLGLVLRAQSAFR